MGATGGFLGGVGSIVGKTVGYKPPVTPANPLLTPAAQPVPANADAYIRATLRRQAAALASKRSGRESTILSDTLG